MRVSALSLALPRGDGSYTPEIVVDGAAGLVGSRRRDVGSAIEKAKHESRTAASVSVTKTGGEQVSIQVGSGSGTGKVLLIGFDHDHTTAIGRGENGGRTLQEANIVRSIRSVGQWSGAPLQINERFPEGQDVAVVLEAPDGQIIGELPGCRTARAEPSRRSYEPTGSIVTRSTSAKAGRPSFNDTVV